MATTMTPLAAARCLTNREPRQRANAAADQRSGEPFALPSDQIARNRTDCATEKRAANAADCTANAAAFAVTVAVKIPIKIARIRPTAIKSAFIKRGAGAACKLAIVEFFPVNALYNIGNTARAIGQNGIIKIA